VAILAILFDLGNIGFGNTQYFGAYDHRVAPGATDRLVAVAQLSDNADKT
jgi:hypothetical protein